jgi:hypothetical protein
MQITEVKVRKKPLFTIIYTSQTPDLLLPGGSRDIIFIYFIVIKAIINIKKKKYCLSVSI